MNKPLLREKFKEDVFLLFLIFEATILVVRSFIFEAVKRHGVYPTIVLRGIHIHHFLIGFFFVLFSAALFIRIKKKRTFVFPLLLGSGLALIVDEFALWYRFQFDDYWSVENLLAIIVAGSFLFGISMFPKKKRGQRVQTFNTLHVNPPSPYISVVIPAFNEEKWLEQTFESIAMQDFQNYELIVVDNNSTDRTGEIAKRWGARVIFESSQGVGYARQAGFLAAEGEIIATTDADTIVPPNWLSRIAAEFKKDSHLAAFGGLYSLNSGPLIARIAISYLAYSVWLLDRIFSGGWSLPGANLAVRKEAFLQAGGFKKELVLGEDAHLSQKLKAIGRVKLDPNFRVETSGRRYQKGLLKGLWTYAPNGFIRMFFKREKCIRLPMIREELPSYNRGVLAVFIGFSAILFSLFYFSNPTIAERKETVFVKRKFYLTGSVLGAVSRKIRYSMEGLKKEEEKILEHRRL